MFYFCLKRKLMKHFQAINLKLAAIECFVKIKTSSIIFYVNKNIPCRILNAEDYLKCFEVILQKQPSRGVRKFSERFTNFQNTFSWELLRTAASEFYLNTPLGTESGYFLVYINHLTKMRQFS